MYGGEGVGVGWVGLGDVGECWGVSAESSHAQVSLECVLLLECVVSLELGTSFLRLMFLVLNFVFRKHV